MDANNEVPCNSLTCSEGAEWKAIRSKLNPVFVPRKLGRHVHKLNAVHDTFLRVAQEGAEADGYSKDLMKQLPYWSMEGTHGNVLSYNYDHENVSDISAGSLMDGTPINLVRRLISQV